MSSRIIKQEGSSGERPSGDRQKYVPREIFDAHEKARRIVREARAEAEELIDRARKESHELRRRGRERGYALGLAEWEKRTLALNHARTELIDEARQEMLELALKVLRRRVHDEPEWMVPLVDEAVQALHEEHQRLRVIVHPDDAECLASLQSELIDKDPRWAAVALVQDESMKRGDCRVENEYSQLDVGLETQLSAIRRLLCPDAEGEGS